MKGVKSPMEATSDAIASFATSFQSLAKANVLSTGDQLRRFSCLGTKWEAHYSIRIL